jgi:hypothetical protein
MTTQVNENLPKMSLFMHVLLICVHKLDLNKVKGKKIGTRDTLLQPFKGYSIAAIQYG